MVVNVTVRSSCPQTIPTNLLHVWNVATVNANFHTCKRFVGIVWGQELLTVTFTTIQRDASA